MAYPTKYTRQYDFVAFQNANPTRPLPADKVNADLNQAQLSSGEIVDFLKTALRSDGFLANQSVGRDQLTTDVITLLDGANGSVTALATLVAAIVTMTANHVTFTPSGSIAATDVQAALQEFDTETTAALALKAPLASPTFTGVPAAPTAAPGTNTTQVSTTAFVKAAIDVVLGGVSASFDTLSEIVAGMQPLDATLTALAAITTAADKLIYATGADAFATTTFSSFARTFVDDADATTVLSTLGGTAAGKSMFTAADAAAQTALLSAFTGDSGAGGGVKGEVPAPAAGDAAANKVLGAGGGWVAQSGGGAPGCGLRLTLQTAVPVMTTTQSGKTTVYATPYTNQFVPLYDGSNMTSTDFGGEVSQATTDATKSPAAGAAYTCYDVFGWDDSSTKRATRGPKWSKTATITVTIAAPGVVTWTAHGLYQGATVSFTTSGALPTGITASTDYFVTVVDANSFKLSTTLANQVAGTFITTTGTQSGVHTGENRTTSRGTGAGTSELTTVKGVKLNANSITNGPAASRGTYLGTIYLNGSSQVDWIPNPAAASGGGDCQLGVWNMYNRVPVVPASKDSADSWAYTTGTWRAANASALNRVTYVVGLSEDWVCATYNGLGGNNSGASGGPVAVGINSTSAFSGSTFWNIGSGGAVFGLVAAATVVPSAGLNYAQALEFGTTGQAFYGDNASANYQMQFSLQTRA